MYAILKKQLIKQIFTSYFEFLLRGEQTKLQQKVFSRLLVAGCMLLLQVLTLSRLAVRKQVFKAFWGRGKGAEGGGKEGGRREGERERLGLKGENSKGELHGSNDTGCRTIQVSLHRW